MRWFLVVLISVLVACGGSGEPTEEEYRDELQSEVLDPLVTSSQEFEDLMLRVQDRPALAENDQWQDDLRAVLDVWNESYANAQEVEPPSDMEDAHEATLIATECLSDAANEIRDVLDKAEGSNTMDALQLFIDCGDLVNDATEALRN